MAEEDTGGGKKGTDSSNGKSKKKSIAGKTSIGHRIAYNEDQKRKQRKMCDGISNCTSMESKCGKLRREYFVIIAPPAL
jgi:hypothetical protein